MVIYGINHINVNMVYSINAVQQFQYSIILNEHQQFSNMHAFSCHEINLERKKVTHERNLKMWISVYIVMNPHFKLIQYSDVSYGINSNFISI